MTGNELYEACKKHRYLLLRYSSGRLMGTNSKVADIMLKKSYVDLTKELKVKSYIPCSFNTYINYKHPFVIVKTIKP